MRRKRNGEVTPAGGADDDGRVTSRAGYWIGGGLIVTAIVGGILWGVLSFAAIGDVVEDFKRARAPGMASVQLEARKYVVYLEGPGVGRDFAPPVEFLLLDPAARQPLPVADYSGSLTYSVSGHSGRAEATVTPPRPGVYELRAGTTADPSAGFAVALGDSVAGRIVRMILGAFAIGGVGLAAGIGFILTTALRRRRRRGGAPPPSPPSGHAGLAGLPG